MISNGKRAKGGDKTSGELIPRDAGEITIYSSRLFFSRGTRRAETRSWNAYSSRRIFRTSGRGEQRTRFAPNQRRFRFPVGPPWALLFQLGVPLLRARFINKDIDMCRRGFKQRGREKSLRGSVSCYEKKKVISVLYIVLACPFSRNRTFFL